MWIQFPSSNKVETNYSLLGFGGISS